jgi:hypothetical protein
MALTNTPAYNSAVSITAVKSFIKWAPGLFSQEFNSYHYVIEVLIILILKKKV